MCLHRIEGTAECFIIGSIRFSLGSLRFTPLILAAICLQYVWDGCFIEHLLQLFNISTNGIKLQC